jgi:hypothetical protein
MSLKRHERSSPPAKTRSHFPTNHNRPVIRWSQTGIDWTSIEVAPTAIDPNKTTD